MALSEANTAGIEAALSAAQTLIEGYSESAFIRDRPILNLRGLVLAAVAFSFDCQYNLRDATKRPFQLWDEAGS